MRISIIAGFLLLIFGCDSDPKINPCSSNDYTLSPRILPGDSINILVPTAFSPNGDLLNEFFNPEGSGQSGFKLTIYKNNLPIFAGSDNEKWDGRDESGTLMPAGKYQYEMTIVSTRNKTFTAKGDISLVSIPKENMCDCLFADMIDPKEGFVQPSQENCN